MSVSCVLVPLTLSLSLCVYIFFRVHRAALWILGEYCSTADETQSLMLEIRNSLGEIPIVEDEMRKAAGEDTEGKVQSALVQVSVAGLAVPSWSCAGALFYIIGQYPLLHLPEKGLPWSFICKWQVFRRSINEVHILCLLHKLGKGRV